MSSLINKRLKDIKPYKPGKPIEELRRELALKGRIIKMASNENALPPSKRVLQAVKKALNSANRYPDGGCYYLKRDLAKMLILDPENIIIGNGSDELIVLALRAFTKKGDEVIVASPTFLIYEIASMIQEGLKIITVPLKGLRYDLDGIAKQLTKKTKIVFIANPDNPTGTYVAEKELNNFLKKVGKNTLVFLDEAYYEFARNIKDYPRAMKYLKKRNVIITRTFSKIYALSGLRVGYGIGKIELIEAMNKVREPFNVNSIAQIAAQKALGDQAFVKKTLNMVKTGKAYLYKEFQAMGLDYVRSATNFILFDAGKNAKKIYKRLLQKGIITREMSAWKLDGYIRVTVCTMEENRIFIKALKGIL